MSPRRPHLGDDYTTGGYRDGIVMLVVIITAILVIWLAYSWALGQSGVPSPP